MSELRFSSTNEALQYLSDKTGKRIKIAVLSMSDVEHDGGGNDITVWVHATTPTGQTSLSKASATLSRLEKRAKEVYDYLSKEFDLSFRAREDWIYPSEDGNRIIFYISMNSKTSDLNAVEEAINDMGGSVLNLDQ